MLLLVTVLLLVLGAIALIIGFVTSNVTPLWVSIACTVGAAVTLWLFNRMGKKGEPVLGTEGEAPLGPPEEALGEPALVTGDAGGDEPTVATAPVAAGDFGDVDELEFPIEDYDSLRVGEILPLLTELDLDELDMVREREESGKNRATVLARVDQLIDQLEAEEEAAASAAPAAEPQPATEVVSAATEPVPAMAGESRAGDLDDDDYFPIEDYDDLRDTEILPLLPELDDDELEMVRDRERDGKARQNILRRVDALLDGDTGPEDELDDEDLDAEPEPLPIVEAPAPAKKAATKAAAKKAPAKKAAAKTAAGSAGEAPAKKAPAKKASAKKAAGTAEKASAKKAAGTAKKAGAAKKAAGTAEKAPAKKAPAKKAPAKKTTKKA